MILWLKLILAGVGALGCFGCVIWQLILIEEERQERRRELRRLHRAANE